MQLTKGAIGNLINRYKAVLKKCHLMNTFGSLAVAGMLVMGGAAVAGAEEITLDQDLQYSYTINNGDSYTINLNNFTLTGQAVYEAILVEDATASIKNGTIKNGNSARAISINNSTANIENVNINTDKRSVNVIATGSEKTAEAIFSNTNITSKQEDAAVFIQAKAENATAKVTINNTSIAGDWYALSGNGTNTGGKTEITINSGNLSGNSYGIYHPQVGVMTINGGTIYGGETGIEVRSGEVNIYGGNITGNGNPFENDPNGNGTTTSGAALAISQHTTNNDIDVNISGGTFIGYYALFENDIQDDDSDNIKISVTGGEFNGKIYSENCKDFITGGTFSDPTALHYLGNGANVSIKLQQDYSGETGTLNKNAFNIGSDRTVAMDLGGHTFSMTEDKNTSAGNISIANGTLDLRKGLTLTGGTLDMVSGSKLTIAGDITLTINGGTFVANAGLLVSKTGEDTYQANGENGISDGSIAGTQGNLNLRWFDDDYTLGEYKSVKNALLNQSGENAELTLLNARLNVKDGQTLVTGAGKDPDGTATLATGAKVVENPENKPVSAGTDVPHTPENYVSVVDSTDASKLLDVSTIATNGNSITAKGLKIADAAGADAVTLQVTSSTGGNNSTLTLVGDSKANTGVIDKDGKALATKAEVAANNTLNMGLTGNTRDQGLTLTEADVTGTLNANGGVTGTSSEYAINALTMQNNSKVNVLNSTMQIGKFTATGGTMFVDPAYVKIDSVAGDFGTQLLVSSGSTVNIGNMSAAELGEALARAGMSVGPNFTVGAGQSVLALATPVALASGGQIVVDANVTSDGKVNGTSVKQAHFGKDSLLVVNGTKINGNTAALTLSAPSTEFTVQNGAKLLISGAQNGKTYKVIANGNGTSAFNGSGYGGSTADGWKGGNLMTSSDMVTLTSDDGMTFTAGVKDARDVFPDLSEGMTNAVNKLYRDSLNNVDSDQMGVRFLSRATDNRFLGMDKNAAAESIESAARIAFAGAAPQMTRMASDAGTNAVVNRLGFANPADGAQAMDAEGKIVDRNTTGFALWIAPLWQSQHGWGLDAGNMDYGFNGNLGGVSLGADYTFENAIRAGITFNIGGGYAESSGGDLSSTENRMNFWGLGAYAGWNYENFGVMADVSYTSTWNQLKQDLDSRLGMGNKLEADVQASAISAGLRAEYLLQTSAMDIIPHIGVRYMSLNTWGYDVDTHGGTVLEGDSLHQDIWTFPIGVTFSKDFALDSGWNFKPSLDFTVIPAAGDIKAKHDVHFTGLPGTYEVETQMMDYLTWQGGVGLELANDNMSIGVNYTLQAGQHTTGHGVFGSFRYEF